MDNKQEDKIVFKADSEGFEITESSSKERRPAQQRSGQQRPPQQGQQRSPQQGQQRSPQQGQQRPSQQGQQRSLQQGQQRPSQQGQRRPPQQSQQRPPQKKQKKRGKAAKIIIPIAIFLVIIGLLGGFVLVYINASYDYYVGPDDLLLDGEKHSYTASSEQELVDFLRHPSLHEGDTIVINGNLMVDIDAQMGGFLSAGLVNFDCSSGSVTFTGGAALLSSGRTESVTMSGVSFAGTKLFIDAKNVDLTWPEASGTGDINVKTLNGSANLNVLNIPAIGAKMTIPVTLENTSGAAQSDIDVELISPNFLFVDGDRVKVSLGAGESTTVDVDVVVLEAGRTAISAVGKAASGEAVISGKSDYVDLIGGGFYSGDPHTHTTEGWTSRDEGTTTENNIHYGYLNGMSYIVSVENDMLGKKLSQSEVDSITGNPGNFLQLTGIEPGEYPELRHYIIYNYDSDFVPETEYEASDFSKWTMQDSIWEARKVEGQEDAFVYIPHPFGYVTVDHTDSIIEAVNNIMSLMGYAGMEIVDQTTWSGTINHQLTINNWNSVNIYNRLRAFAIGASNNITSEYVGSRYTRGYMDSLSEANIYDMLRSTGNMFATNGPDLRFSVGNVPMGSDLYVNADEEVMINAYASSKSPLTSVKVLRYDVTGKWGDAIAEEVYFEDLTGKGLYEFSLELAVTPAVGEDREGNITVNDQYYRLEVMSEKSDMYDDIGMAYSNPVWVSTARTGSNDTSMLQVSYEEKPVSVFGLNLDLSFLHGLVESVKGEELYGTEFKQLSNGTKYFTGTGRFTINALKATAKENQLVTINYHRYDSDYVADKITVMVMAEDRLSYEVETYYILDGFAQKTADAA